MQIEKTGTMQIERIAAALGAVVSGVDLREPLDNLELEQLRDALVEHQVLFFHDQDLDDDQQRAFASRFGTLGVFPVAKLMGSTTDMSYIEDTAESPPDADGWHTDITWIAEPPKIAVLNARIIPEYGGDTLWASLFAAYDALSPAMQQICERLTVRHTAGPDFLERVSRGREEIVEVIKREFPPVEHPLVRTHPVSGRRALFVAGGFMDQIVGMHRDESDALLGYLKHHIENPNFQVRWHWRPYDLAMWDEASTNHRALSDHFPQHRMMRRCTIDGDRPFFRPG
ncbi:MAG: TauD/TfdA family dioxygenase [Acidimicrobiia bacterium]